MHDFILGAVVIVDALVGIVTWRGVSTMLFGVLVIVGALAIGRAGLAAVVWLVMRRPPVPAEASETTGERS